ncbi:MAG: hypothetical protein CM1200mP2_35830 [Planctomycetaceae bacterium]|nr:MAG: hypothetical protein CM1200mP2_35830 [Planctomycetaceae bacterium]
MIGKTVLGLTIACARCHDHKFDPIPTADYYALAGIFRSTETLYGGSINRPKNIDAKLKVYLVLGDTSQLGEVKKHQKTLANLQKQRQNLAKRRNNLKKRLPKDGGKNDAGSPKPPPAKRRPAKRRPAKRRPARRRPTRKSRRESPPRSWRLNSRWWFSNWAHLDKRIKSLKDKLPDLEFASESAIAERWPTVRSRSAAKRAKQAGWFLAVSCRLSRLPTRPRSPTNRAVVANWPSG